MNSSVFVGPRMKRRIKIFSFWTFRNDEYCLAFNHYLNVTFGSNTKQTSIMLKTLILFLRMTDKSKKLERTNWFRCSMKLFPLMISNANHMNLPKLTESAHFYETGNGLFILNMKLSINKKEFVCSVIIFFFCSFVNFEFFFTKQGKNKEKSKEKTWKQKKNNGK